ncbi:hypothetical protein PHLCEN_2v622, partial [Hermanssonia centrifuga]
AINKFCLVADVSKQVPKLRNKNYSDFAISNAEWEQLRLIHEVLDEPRAAQAAFSSEKYSTVWRTIPTLECLQERWEIMVKEPKFAKISFAIEAGLEKLRKWYKAVDDSDMYFICLALDPTYKIEYTKQNWDNHHHQNGMVAFRKTFDTYAEQYEPKTTKQAVAAQSTQITISRGYASAFAQRAVVARLETGKILHNPQHELDDYLEAPLKDPDKITDAIAWWGIHSSQYPILSRLAHDYLAIQGSAVASERAFSSGGRTGTALRNQLAGKTFEALQILKSGYRDGVISAAQEAEEYSKHGSDDS